MAVARTDLIWPLLRDKVTLMKTSEEFADGFVLDSLPSGRLHSLACAKTSFSSHMIGYYMHD
jgi:hypothetical protein